MSRAGKRVLAALRKDRTDTSPLRQLGRVNRIEVVDEDGRAYIADGITVVARIQDEGHTLKLIVRPGGTQ